MWSCSFFLEGRLDRGACSRAAKNGHIDCLKYAWALGCFWNSHTCAQAAWCGNLECLRFAHEHGCPWDDLTYVRAAMFGKLDCLRYALEQGCPTRKIPFPSKIQVLRIVLQHAEPFPKFVGGPCLILDDSNVCLLVSDSCLLFRKKCKNCVPLLRNILHETIGNLPWDLTVLITTFL